VVIASVVALAVVGVFIRSFGAAESGGRASPVLEIVAFVLGVWVPLFALIYACVRSRVAVVALAFCVGLSVNLVFLTHAMPAAAVTDNSSVFTFKRTTGFNPPDPDMLQNYTPTGAAATCPAAGAGNWTCTWTSDTFTSGQTISAGTAQVDLYLSNQNPSIVRKGQGGIQQTNSVCGSSLSRPAVVDGDVLLMACTFRGGTGTTVTSVPSGWTLVGTRVDNTTSISLVVYSHVVTDASTEPTQNTWNLSSSVKLLAYYLNFSGLDNANPIDVEANQATASATSHPAPAVTTTVANDALLTFHSTADCVNWAPPGGMTEVLDSTGCSGGASSNVDMEINELALGGAGPIGGFTATNDGAAVGVTKTVALRKATAAITCNLTVQVGKPIVFRSQATTVVNNGTQVAVSKPAGATEGDVLVAGITFGPVGGTSMSAVPANWTLVRAASNGGAIWTNTYTHVVGPSEPANYTWTANQAVQLIGDITAYSGVDTVTPVDLSAAATGFQTMPTMTTTGPNELLIAYFGGSNTVSPSNWTPAPGMLERSDLVTSVASQPWLGVSHQEQVWPTAGATGARTTNSVPTVNGPVGQWLALRPATNSVLGTGTVSITSPAGPTLRSVSFAMAAVTFATGERLQVAVTAPDDPVNCGASVSYDGVSEPSKLTVATDVPEGVAGLLLLAPALPLGARWWKRRRP